MLSLSLLLSHATAHLIFQRHQTLTQERDPVPNSGVVVEGRRDRVASDTHQTYSNKLLKPPDLVTITRP
jgi:hypothetical protein